MPIANPLTDEPVKLWGISKYVAIRQYQHPPTHQQIGTMVLVDARYWDRYTKRLKPRNYLWDTEIPAAIDALLEAWSYSLSINAPLPTIPEPLAAHLRDLLEKKKSQEKAESTD